METFTIIFLFSAAYMFAEFCANQIQGAQAPVNSSLRQMAWYILKWGFWRVGITLIIGFAIWRLWMNTRFTTIAMVVCGVAGFSIYAVFRTRYRQFLESHQKEVAYDPSIQTILLQSMRMSLVGIVLLTGLFGFSISETWKEEGWEWGAIALFLSTLLLVAASAPAIEIWRIWNRFLKQRS